MGKHLSALKRLVMNPISLIGLGISCLATLLGLPMMFLDMFTFQTNPYTGIFTYLILPVTAGLGVAIAAAGMLWERRKIARQPGALPIQFPKLDLNNPRHRIIILGCMGGVVVLIFLLTITGYRAYQFSDSTAFCGLTCHSVMKPEHTAYLNSPHARVDCVDCHIGPGVDWFVKSKITGAYQIYSVIFKKYNRPIETPIKNLRPAQETCEQCHWPAKFFGAQQKTFTHYLGNEKNDPWQIQMLIKIGGGDPALGEASGIHWHMNIKNKIEYKETDQRHNVIPWVRSTDPKGTVTDYVTTDNPPSSEDLNKLAIRRMDCVGCHNRPTHIFNPPDRAVDNAMAAGLIDPTLPYIKRESVRLLASDYSTENEALEAIQKGVVDFYQKNYPHVSLSHGGSILQSAQTLQLLYSKNMFPEMKTDWRAHLNHLSHIISDGCFRCHDGLHKSTNGKIISSDCNTCHTILAQGPPGKLAKTTLHAQTFQHPVDLGMDVTTMKCSACHTGTSGL